MFSHVSDAVFLIFSHFWDTFVFNVSILSVTFVFISSTLPCIVVEILPHISPAFFLVSSHFLLTVDLISPHFLDAFVLISVHFLLIVSAADYKFKPWHIVSSIICVLRIGCRKVADRLGSFLILCFFLAAGFRDIGYSGSRNTECCSFLSGCSFCITHAFGTPTIPNTRFA